MLRVSKPFEYFEPETIQEAVRMLSMHDEEAKPITDIRSTAEYRKETTKVLVRRAVEKALERAKT